MSPTQSDMKISIPSPQLVPTVTTLRSRCIFNKTSFTLLSLALTCSFWNDDISENPTDTFPKMWGLVCLTTWQAHCGQTVSREITRSTGAWLFRMCKCIDLLPRVIACSFFNLFHNSIWNYANTTLELFKPKPSLFVATCECSSTNLEHSDTLDDMIVRSHPKFPVDCLRWFWYPQSRATSTPLIAPSLLKDLHV